MASELDFEELVDHYYQPLYRFALSLTRMEADACDLTQQTFFIYQTKGHQLRDPAKVKSWLFTAMHREFLSSQRHENRFPHFELEEMNAELPSISPASFSHIDGSVVLEALKRVEEPHQAAVALFYLEDYSYKEIAEILGIPIGTVKSRLARGIARLQQIILGPTARPLALESNHHE